MLRFCQKNKKVNIRKTKRYNKISGYKSAGNGKYIVKLAVDTISARTNLYRKTINKKNALFRTSTAYVTGIYEKFNKLNEIESIGSDYDSKFIYQKGHYSNVPNFDPNIDAISSSGIHFFLTKTPAYHFSLEKNINYTGKYMTWFDDGQIRTVCYFKNGYLHGQFKEYHDNGKIYKEGRYKNGRLKYYHKYDKYGNFRHTYPY